MLALVTALGGFCLAGCTDGAQQSSGSASQVQQSTSSSSDSSSSASSASDDDQDNCYGDDLPAVKK